MNHPFLEDIDVDDVKDESGGVGKEGVKVDGEKETCLSMDKVMCGIIDQMEFIDDNWA